MPVRLKAALAAVFLALSFVFMGVWARMMEGSFGTFQQVYLRLLLAAALAAIVFRRHVGPAVFRDITGREWIVYVVRALLSYTVGVGLFTVAVLETKLSIVSFVASLPVLGLLGWMMFGEKVRVATLPFLALSVVGLLLMTSVDVGDLHLGRGEITAVISMLGFNLGYLMSRFHSARFSNAQNTTVLLLLGWIPLLALSLLAGEPLVPRHVSAAAWFALGISAVLNVAGLMLINYVFASLKAYVAGNLLLLEGVFALIVGLALYAERPTGIELVGAALILGCAYAISALDARGNRKEPVVPPPAATGTVA